MDLGFKDRVALITGTASQIGMGKEIALTLAKEGCDIISCDIDLAGAEKTADEVKALGHKAVALKADISNKAEVDDMVKTAFKEFGRIDILVNNAGSISSLKPFIEQTDEESQKDMDINLYGAVHCCQAVLPIMVKQKYGKVINFSSIACRIAGSANAYHWAKTAILSLTRALAAEFGPSGINVNGIAPGMTLTNFGGPMPAEIREQFKASVPTRNVSTVQDIANLVAFLASDISRNITAQVIAIDGGATMP